MEPSEGPEFVRPIVCGAVGELVVDIALYPLDTIKIRQQSAQGFQASGGFRNLYRGLGSVLIGAAPTSALFFLVYSNLKEVLPVHRSLGEALCASGATVVACAFGVPMEVVKQRAQAGTSAASLRKITSNILATEGVRGLYRGFTPMCAREMPFAFIEMPVWEFIRREFAKFSKTEKCSPMQSAVAGSAAGCLACILTAPLDLVMTRIILADKPKSIGKTFVDVCSLEGPKKLFVGIVPRTLWTGLAGFIFFYAYEFTHDITDFFL